MRGTCTNTGFALVAFFAAACGGGSLTAKAPSFEPPNPLGQGYLLIPLPSDDPSILGRVLRTPPTPGTNLEEMTQPNPCVEFLEPERASAQSADFVDAEDVSLSGGGSAVLAGYGFSAEIGRATHLYYRLRVDSRTHRADTLAYSQCCQTKGGCGYGYVATLIHGTGEYAAVSRENTSAGVTIGVASVEGYQQMHVLRRRSVRGFVAALVRITATQSQQSQTTALGLTPTMLGFSEESLPDAVRTLYERRKMWFTLDHGWVIVQGNTGISENRFIEKYSKLSGSSELKPYLRDYASDEILWCSTTLAVGGATWFVASRVASEEHSAFPEFAVWSLGGLVASFPLVGCLWELGSYDGAPTEHTMPEALARGYMVRYNRLLIRQLATDVRNGVGARTEERTPAVRAAILPGFLGLKGSF